MELHATSSLFRLQTEPHCSRGILLIQNPRKGSSFVLQLVAYESSIALLLPPLTPDFPTVDVQGYPTLGGAGHCCAFPPLRGTAGPGKNWPRVVHRVNKREVATRGLNTA